MSKAALTLFAIVFALCSANDGFAGFGFPQRIGDMPRIPHIGEIPRFPGPVDGTFIDASVIKKIPGKIEMNYQEAAPGIVLNNEWIIEGGPIDDYSDFWDEVYYPRDEFSLSESIEEAEYWYPLHEVNAEQGFSDEWTRHPIDPVVYSGEVSMDLNPEDYTYDWSTGFPMPVKKHQVVSEDLAEISEVLPSVSFYRRDRHPHYIYIDVDMDDYRHTIMA